MQFIKICFINFNFRAQSNLTGFGVKQELEMNDAETKYSNECQFAISFNRSIHGQLEGSSLSEQAAVAPKLSFNPLSGRGKLLTHMAINKKRKQF